MHPRACKVKKFRTIPLKKISVQHLHQFCEIIDSLTHQNKTDFLQINIPFSYKILIENFDGEKSLEGWNIRK